MSKKRLLLHAMSMATLTAPNGIYLACNYDVLKEANVVALTMTTMIILAIVGLGALAHFKANKGVWVTMIGIFVLSLSNISYVAGIALIIEGAGLTVDGYIFKPLITNTKMKELEDAGKSITYTRNID